MKRFTDEEMQEIKAYLVDFVDSFDHRELAQAVREHIISVEEIEDAMRRKMEL